MVRDSAVLVQCEFPKYCYQLLLPHTCLRVGLLLDGAGVFWTPRIHVYQLNRRWKPYATNIHGAVYVCNVVAGLPDMTSEEAHHAVLKDVIWVGLCFEMFVMQVPEGWEEVAFSIADLGGAEVGDTPEL